MSTDTTIPDANGVARDQLRAFVERIERTEEEIATLNADKSDIYKEARAVGFDVKVLRKVVAKRKLETHVREEQDAIFDMYWEALYGAPVHVHTRTRENIEELRSDNGLNIQTKHEDIRTAPETADELSRPAPLAGSGGDRSIPSPDAGGVKMDAVQRTPGRADDLSAHKSAQSGQATNTHSEKATVATQGEATAPTSDERVSLQVDDRSDAAANAGGDDVDGSAERANHDENGEGAARALPAKPKFVLRPYCRNPGETCGGSGTTHCHSCLKAREEVAA
ncbi:DUF2312 domain-containing protein [Shinella granuli]|uniref:Uncharacterized protein (UPF0335 family) n=1 Tax=Shinella granuli TaxID=323621 RepID=A0A4R2D322_SHIGR|nr:DUF2312 domain-containing protein [Shinella granuli]TCN48076.1 uncharacterized protein (UPF0335 family) [Shinella granuli]